MTSCLTDGCSCDCHVPPKPRPEQTASPELVALRKREVAAALEQARLKRTDPQ